MARDRFVWLGAPGFLQDGDLDFNALTTTDKWTVWPLLRWQEDDTLSLAALIRLTDDNLALPEILGWLGATCRHFPDDANRQWRVVDFEETAKQASDWNLPITLQPPPVDQLFVAGGALTTEVGLTGLLVRLPFLSLQDSKCQLAAAPAGGVNATLTMTLKATLPGGVGDTTIPLTIIFHGATGAMTWNAKPISGDLTEGQLTIPLDDNGPWLVAYKQGEDWRATLEVRIAGGECTQRLLKNFPAQVKFTWQKAAMRLDPIQPGRDGGIAIVTPANASADDVIAEAEFQLPLIQSGADDPVSNAVAQLVTAKIDGGGTLNVLTYKFQLHRGEVERLLGEAAALIRFDWNGGTFTAGTFVAEQVGQLSAELVELVNDATWDSFVGQVGELTGVAGKHLSAKLKDGKKVLEGVNDLLRARASLKNFALPLALEVAYDNQTLAFLVVIRLNLLTGRLSDNRAYFYIAKKKGAASGQLDLDILHLTLPPRENPQDLPDESDHDGYLDFRNQQLALSAKRKPAANGRRPVTMLFPGKLEGNPNNKRTRLRLVLNEFDPSRWPDEKSDERLQLRLGSRGITLCATADTTQSASIPVGDTGGPDLPLRLQEDRQGLKSEIVIIDNQIRYASLFGTIAVPGFDNLEAEVHLGLRQSSKDKVPAVVAEVGLQKSDQSSLARLRTPWFQGQLDDLRMRLDWDRDNKKWEVDAWASGALSFSSRIGSTGGVEGMDSPRAIPFRDLKLTELHKPTGGEVAIGSADSPARFELLDGMFRVEFYETRFAYNLTQKSAALTVKRARFQFQKKDEVDVAVDAGGFTLAVTDGRVKLSLPSTLGLSLQIKDSVRFQGEISWVDNPTERYFAAGGSLTLSGFPEVAGMLKIGTGRKENGKMAPNIAIYGAFNYEAELFAGVTLKRIGVGLGVNNRLRALGADPRPEEIIQRIDQLTPEIPSAWSFVTQKGTYVSIVASALIGSNRGSETTVNAYLAWLVMSIDTNLDIVAAGKFWLFSSPKFIGRADNANRPALVGAMALRPRKKTLSFVAETRPRPAIEANSQLQSILSKAHARYSFFLSPQMADSYLEELSYADKFFGVPMQFLASYRLAIGKFGGLMRASLAIRGHYSNSLSAGVGGFSFAGTLGWTLSSAV